MPTGNTSPDYFGGMRHGLDYYSNSLVALDVATGKVAWHFQTVHHDLWITILPGLRYCSTFIGMAGLSPRWQAVPRAAICSSSIGLRANPFSALRSATFLRATLTAKKHRPPSHSRSLPARVVGLWPDAGAHRVVEVDRQSLERAADRVVTAVSTLVDGRVRSLAAR